MQKKRPTLAEIKALHPLSLKQAQELANRHGLPFTMKDGKVVQPQHPATRNLH